MAESHFNKPTQPLSDEAMAAAFEAEHQPPTHDQKWARLQASDAPFVRKALVRAEGIRTEELDPGDAYLQGIADYKDELDQRKEIKFLNDLYETPTNVDSGE